MDLFVVLLGGATALMPIFAQDILQTGPWGLGLLRAAPAVGAIIVSAVLAFYPWKNLSEKPCLERLLYMGWPPWFLLYHRTWSYPCLR